MQRNVKECLIEMLRYLLFKKLSINGTCSRMFDEHFITASTFVRFIYSGRYKARRI